MECRDRLGGDLTELGLGRIGDFVGIGVDAAAGSVQRLSRLRRQRSHQSGIGGRRLDLSHHLLLVEDGELNSGIGIGQSVEGAADPGLDIGQVLVLGDLNGRQIIDHVFDLLVVERPTAGNAPSRHRRVATTVGHPEVHLVFFVSEEDVVERRGRPLNGDTRALLDIWGDTTRALRAVTVETAELGDEVLAPLDRALGELHDEALLSLLLGEEVERERNGEECGESDGRLLPALQPPGFDLLVVDTWSKIGSNLLATPAADGRDEEHAQPGDPCD